MAQNFTSNVLNETMMMIYNYHKEAPRAYMFSTEAQQYYDALNDEHVADFNAMYDTSGKHSCHTITI